MAGTGTFIIGRVIAEHGDDFRDFKQLQQWGCYVTEGCIIRNCVAHVVVVCWFAVLLCTASKGVLLQAYCCELCLQVSGSLSSCGVRICFS